MKGNEIQSRKAIRFCHFSRQSYAAFRTLNKVVLIGVLTIPTLTFALTEPLQAQVQQQEKLQLYELEEIEDAHLIPGEDEQLEADYRKMVHGRQQTVVVDYRSQVQNDEMEYTRLDYVQESMF